MKGDPLSSLWTASATVGGSAPVSVACLVKRGAGLWKRLDVDTSPPYRGFLEPARFKKNERVELVAIARALDGRTATSAVVPFRVRTR